MGHHPVVLHGEVAGLQPVEAEGVHGLNGVVSELHSGDVGGVVEVARLAAQHRGHDNEAAETEATWQNAV